MPAAACAVAAPVLTAALLSRIHRLNLEYLHLLRDLPLSGTCAHADCLPPALLQNLRQVPATALPDLAAVPYALYTLGFEDQELWQTALSAPLEDASRVHRSPPRPNVRMPDLCVAEEPATGCRVPMHAAFGDAGIFFAWHLTVANPLAARVMYGVPNAVSECLQAAWFAKLQAVMRTCPWLLMPRWAANPHFWPELIDLALAGNARVLRQVQLLGNQLIACDLRLAESPPPELAGRLRAARSTQLQRWKQRLRS